jgi:hypothetical protein
MPAPQEPLDMSLLAPRPERLQQLSVELGYGSYGEIPANDRAVVYSLGLQEMRTSALGVLAQFCARMAGS